MPESKAQDLATKILAPPFVRDSPDLPAASDPIADTPMVVTLDQLKPYDLNPRIARNPKYDDIKASIRERGLDSPPAITRRPGEAHYIIRNGGNTRLAILRELWSETKDEKFFRILCLFRPWSARGEIVALTGHLCENELHGTLSFIERALAVEKARGLYEREAGKALSQSELARRLTADGYPITQSYISRMQDAILYLLPAIPNLLYGGLGKHQIERLIALRRAAIRTWEHSAPQRPREECYAIFQDALALFDGDCSTFSAQRVQDELIGQLADTLGADYDALALAIVDAEIRGSGRAGEPMFHVKQSDPATLASNTSPANLTRDPERRTPQPTSAPASAVPSIKENATPVPAPTTDRVREPTRDKGAPPSDEERVNAHIVSPAETTERLKNIQRTIAQATGDTLPDFRENVVQAIPVQAGGLHPISDVWYIEPAVSTPDRLRVHIAQLALEIADEAGVAHRIEAADEGIGFTVQAKVHSGKDVPPNFLGRAVLALLSALSNFYLPPRRTGIEPIRLADELAPLLLGTSPAQRASHESARLSDVGLVKLYRMIRLARRLLDLQSATSRSTPGA